MKRRRTRRKPWPRAWLGLTGLVGTSSGTIPGWLEASAQTPIDPSWAEPATAVAAPAGVSAVGSSVLLGTVGDGKPDFLYDPFTGDLTFAPDGAHFTTTGGAASFVSGLIVQSVSGSLLFNNASPAYKLGAGATLTPTLLGSSILTSPGMTDGSTTFDIGNVLPAGLSASFLTSDLTLKYQSINGGQLKIADLIIADAGGTGTITPSPGTSLSAAGDLLFNGTSAGTVFSVNAGQSYPSQKNLIVTNNTTLSVQGGVVSTTSNYLTIISPGAAIALSGGSLITGSISNAGSFSFTSGLLRLTASPIIFDAGELLGPTLTLAGASISATAFTLRAGADVEVTGNGSLLATTGAISVDAGALLRVSAGGAVRAGSLTLASPGGLDYQSGTLSLSAGGLTLSRGSPGDLSPIAIGDNLAVGGTLRFGGSGLASVTQTGGTVSAAMVDLGGPDGNYVLRGGSLTAATVSGQVFVLGGVASISSMTGPLVVGDGTSAVSISLDGAGRILAAPSVHVLSGSSIFVNPGGTLAGTSTVTIDGGAVVRVTSGALFAGVLDGTVDFRSGTVSVSSGDLTVGRGAAGDAAPIAAGDRLSAGGVLHFAGGTAIASITQNGGSVSASTIDIGGPAGVYAMNGGALTASILSGGTFSVSGGASLSSLGGGALTLGSGSLLRVTGGALQASALTGPGTFDFRSGTVTIAAGDLSIARGSAGDTNALGSGDNLNIGGTLHFAGGTTAANVTQTGGVVSAGVIDIGGTGGFYCVSGGTISAPLLPGGLFAVTGSGRLTALSDALTLGSGATARVNGGGLLSVPGALTVNAGGSIELGVGGTARAGSLGGGPGSYVFQGGTLVSAAPVIFDIGQPLGSSFVLNNSTLSASAFTLRGGADVTLAGPAGMFSTTGAVNLDSGSILHVSGGSLNAASISGAGTLDYQSGSLSLSSSLLDLSLTLNLSAGNLSASSVTLHSGANITLLPGGSISTPGLLTMENGSLLHMNGGALNAGSLSNTAGGSFDFRSGTVSLATGDLTLSRGSPGDLGPILAGDNLRIGGALHFGGGTAVAAVTQTGGSVSAGLLDLGGPAGSYVLRGGSLTATDLIGQLTLLGGSVSISAMTAPLTVGDGTTNAVSVLVGGSNAAVSAPNIHVLSGAYFAVYNGGTIAASSNLIVDPGGTVRVGYWGGTLTAGSVTGIIDFATGSVAVAHGDLTILRGGPGNSLSLGYGDSLQAAGAIHFAGGTAAATVYNDGAALQADSLDIGGAAGTYSMSNGTLSVASLPAGQFTLTTYAQIRALNNTLTLGDGTHAASVVLSAPYYADYLPVLRLSAKSQFTVADGFLRATSVVTLDPSALLTVAGGWFKTASFTGPAPLDFRSGTVIVTAGDLVLSRGAPGHLDPILPGDNISVSGTLRFGGTGIANVTQQGGFVSAGAVDLGGPAGTYTMLGGSLSANALLGTLSVIGGAATIGGTATIGGGINVGVSGGSASLSLGGTSGLTVALDVPSITIGDKSSLFLLPGPVPLRHNADQITLASTAMLDIGNHELITSTPPATIKGYLASAYNINNGDWAGPGITSSIARKDPIYWNMGYAVGGAPANPRADVPAGKVLVAAVPLGDINMDGKFDFADLLQFARAAKYNTGQAGSYTDGDVDYDGQVTIFDLELMFYNGFGAGAGRIAPTGKPQQPGYGGPDIEYNPITGDVRFYAGYLTNPRLAALMVWSASSKLIPGNLSNNLVVNGQVLQPDQIDLFSTYAPYGLLSYYGSEVDLGQILPPGLSTSQVSSDLIVSYQLWGEDAVRLGSVLTPEPSSVFLVGLGAATSLLARRRRRRRVAL
jgi:hypothetical protein